MCKLKRASPLLPLVRCSEPKGDGEYVMLAAEPVLPPTSVVPRIRLVASLSFAAGYVDANTKFRFMAFGSLMSGNAVELGIAMSRHEWGYAGCCALNILAFQVGVLTDLMFTHRHTSRRNALHQDCVKAPHGSLLHVRHQGASRKASAWLICGLLVACDALGVSIKLLDYEDPLHEWSHIRTTGALAAVAMGAQNAWTTRSSIKASTVIIGANLQKVAELLHRRLVRWWQAVNPSAPSGLWNFRMMAVAAMQQKHEAEQEPEEVATLLLGAVAYILGAVAGALAAQLLPHGSLLPAAVLIFLNLEPWR